VIDPTCSIVLERQEAEPDIMKRKPRNPNEKILTAGVLAKSLIQGLVVFVASFGTYYYFILQNAENALLARAMGLSIILLSNVMLVHVNSSDTVSVIHTFKKLIRDKVMLVVTFGTIAGLLAILYTPINHFLKIGSPSIAQLGFAFAAAFIGVFWYEIVKYFKRVKLSKNK
jgi:Ca2+-transporting ATPase